MPEIKPFRGWRYDLKRAGKAAKLVAPPYDIISPAQQEKLYRESPYNAIRLELTKDEPGTDKYQKAAQTLTQWKGLGAIQRESEPALYVYEQIYKEGTRTQTRIGFLAAMKADESAVKKHEDTLAGPKEDRLKLLGATRTNLSPIWGLFEDASATIHKALCKSVKSKPVLDVTLDGVRHRLFVETRPEIVDVVTRSMKAKPMFIADGHHRFETASKFAQMDRTTSPRADGISSGAQYVMTYFSDVRNNPFKIYPTHRLMRLGGLDWKTALAPAGELKKVKNLDAVLSKLSGFRGKKAVYDYGFYSKKDGFYLLSLNKKTVSSIKKNPVDVLDVAVLHSKIIDPCFGIRKIEKSDAIDFTRDAKEAIEKVSKGGWELAAFLRPTSLDEMILTSKKGLKMPQKSTYFYPKLLTGLVFRGLDD